MSKKKKLLYFAIEVWGKCIKDRVGAYAAQSAFFILLSAIPFVILLLQLIRFLPFSEDDLIYVINTVFPEYVVPIVKSILDELYSGSIGLVAATIFAAIWTSAKAMHGLSYGLDAICNAEETRNWFVMRFWAILHTMIFAVGVIFLLGTTVFWKLIRSTLYEFLGDINFPIYLVNIWVKWILIIILLTLIFAIMYSTFTVNRLSFIGQLPGALFCSAGWFVFSNFLTIYVNYFHGFSMYGSLTTIALAMFWLYVCIYMIMIGAEINEALRRRKKGKNEVI